MPDDVTRVARLLRQHVGLPVDSVVPLGAGTDNTAFLIDGNLVVRFRRDEGSPGAAVEREARLLSLVAQVSPVPVPVPRFVLPDLGCLAYAHLAGEPLLRLPPRTRAVVAEPVGRALGELLAALHAVPPDRVDGLVETDSTSPSQWLAEAAQTYDELATAVPSAFRRPVERFLGEAAPPQADALRFSHNDLGIEHVLVGPGHRRVTGVLDWSDAALTDPAYDVGLLLRDLGPRALTAALDGYHLTGTARPGLRERALFYARCALIEDLAYGQEAGHEAYADKSLTALGWLFTDGEPSGR